MFIAVLSRERCGKRHEVVAAHLDEVLGARWWSSGMPVLDAGPAALRGGAARGRIVAPSVCDIATSERLSGGYTQCGQSELVAAERATPGL